MDSRNLLLKTKDHSVLLLKNYVGNSKFNFNPLNKPLLLGFRNYLVIINPYFYSLYLRKAFLFIFKSAQNFSKGFFIYDSNAYKLLNRYVLDIKHFSTSIFKFGFLSNFKKVMTDLNFKYKGQDKYNFTRVEFPDYVFLFEENFSYNYILNECNRTSLPMISIMNSDIAVTFSSYGIISSNTGFQTSAYYTLFFIKVIKQALNLKKFDFYNNKLKVFYKNSFYFLLNFKKGSSTPTQLDEILSQPFSLILNYLKNTEASEVYFSEQNTFFARLLIIKRKKLKWLKSELSSYLADYNDEFYDYLKDFEYTKFFDKQFPAATATNKDTFETLFTYYLEQDKANFLETKEFVTFIVEIKNYKDLIKLKINNMDKFKKFLKLFRYSRAFTKKHKNLPYLNALINNKNKFNIFYFNKIIRKLYYFYKRQERKRKIVNLFKTYNRFYKKHALFDNEDYNYMIRNNFYYFNKFNLGPKRRLRYEARVKSFNNAYNKIGVDGKRIIAKHFKDQNFPYYLRAAEYHRKIVPERLQNLFKKFHEIYVAKRKKIIYTIWRKLIKAKNKKIIMMTKTQRRALSQLNFFKSIPMNEEKYYDRSIIPPYRVKRNFQMLKKAVLIKFLKRKLRHKRIVIIKKRRKINLLKFLDLIVKNFERSIVRLSKADAELKQGSVESGTVQKILSYDASFTDFTYGIPAFFYKLHEETDTPTRVQQELTNVVVDNIKSDDFQNLDAIDTEFKQRKADLKNSFGLTELTVEQLNELKLNLITLQKEHNLVRKKANKANKAVKRQLVTHLVEQNNLLTDNEQIALNLEKAKLKDRMDEYCSINTSKIDQEMKNPRRLAITTPIAIERLTERKLYADTVRRKIRNFKKQSINQPKELVLKQLNEYQRNLTEIDALIRLDKAVLALASNDQKALERHLERFKVIVASLNWLVVPFYILVEQRTRKDKSSYDVNFIVSEPAPIDNVILKRSAGTNWEKVKTEIWSPLAEKVFKDDYVNASVEKKSLCLAELYNFFNYRVRRIKIASALKTATTLVHYFESLKRYSTYLNNQPTPTEVPLSVSVPEPLPSKVVVKKLTQPVVQKFEPKTVPKTLSFAESLANRYNKGRTPILIKKPIQKKVYYKRHNPNYIHYPTPPVIKAIIKKPRIKLEQSWLARLKDIATGSIFTKVTKVDSSELNSFGFEYFKTYSSLYPYNEGQLPVYNFGDKVKVDKVKLNLLVELIDINLKKLNKNAPTKVISFNFILTYLVKNRFITTSKFNFYKKYFLNFLIKKSNFNFMKKFTFLFNTYAIENFFNFNLNLKKIKKFFKQYYFLKHKIKKFKKNYIKLYKYFLLLLKSEIKKLTKKSIITNLNEFSRTNKIINDNFILENSNHTSMWDYLNLSRNVSERHLTTTANQQPVMNYIKYFHRYKVKMLLQYQKKSFYNNFNKFFYNRNYFYSTFIFKPIRTLKKQISSLKEQTKLYRKPFSLQNKISLKTKTILTNLKNFKKIPNQHGYSTIQFKKGTEPNCHDKEVKVGGRRDYLNLTNKSVKQILNVEKKTNLNLIDEEKVQQYLKDYIENVLKKDQKLCVSLNKAGTKAMNFKKKILELAIESNKDLPTCLTLKALAAKLKAIKVEPKFKKTKLVNNIISPKVELSKFNNNKINTNYNLKNIASTKKDNNFKIINNTKINLTSTTNFKNYSKNITINNDNTKPKHFVVAQPTNFNNNFKPANFKFNNNNINFNGSGKPFKKFIVTEDLKTKPTINPTYNKIYPNNNLTQDNKSFNNVKKEISTTNFNNNKFDVKVAARTINDNSKKQIRIDVKPSNPNYVNNFNNNKLKFSSASNNVKKESSTTNLKKDEPFVILTNIKSKAVVKENFDHAHPNTTTTIKKPFINYIRTTPLLNTDLTKGKNISNPTVAKKSYSTSNKSKLQNYYYFKDWKNDQYYLNFKRKSDLMLLTSTNNVIKFKFNAISTHYYEIKNLFNYYFKLFNNFKATTLVNKNNGQIPFFFNVNLNLPIYTSSRNISYRLIFQSCLNSFITAYSSTVQLSQLTQLVTKYLNSTLLTTNSTNVELAASKFLLIDDYTNEYQNLFKNLQSKRYLQTLANYSFKNLKAKLKFLKLNVVNRFDKHLKLFAKKLRALSKLKYRRVYRKLKYKRYKKFKPAMFSQYYYIKNKYKRRKFKYSLIRKKKIYKKVYRY